MAARGMVEEMLSIQMLYSDARSCPKCRMTVSKSEGCNKVVCISCGQAFCFICGKAIIAGYSHFEYGILIYPGSFNKMKRRVKI
jgi:E3 ubiquitin-protein ligase RNF14